MYIFPNPLLGMLKHVFEGRVVMRDEVRGGQTGEMRWQCIAQVVSQEGKQIYKISSF